MAEEILGQTKPDLKVLYDRYGLTLGVTRDWLQVYVTYVPQAPSESRAQENLDVLNEEFFRALLAEHKVIIGLQQEAISSFLADPPHNKEVLIAQGVSPVHGENARIEYVYDQQDQSPSPKKLNGGKVDLKELNLNINVRKGDVLARKTPATDGKPGKKANGEPVAAKKGKDRSLFVGRNTVLSDDGLQLMAQIDGTISRVSNKISVVEVYTVKGDVDYSTGNISFVGSVEVFGNILSGFRVEAKDDVMVNGVVEGAGITAGGNVIVRGGIQGGEKADIEAQGDIEARFVNSAKLKAGQCVRISGPVMHSVLEAGNKVELLGRNGVLNGGVARATHSVEAENIGVELGVATTVEVGVDPSRVERLQAMEAELKTAQVNVLKLNQVISTLNALKQKQGSLPPDREKMLLESIKTRYAMMALAKQLEKDHQQLEEEIKQARTGHVQARGAIFPGVTVRIGRSVSKIDHEMKHVTLRREGGEIVAA